jgi:hypothetical protein
MVNIGETGGGETGGGETDGVGIYTQRDIFRTGLESRCSVSHIGDAYTKLLTYLRRLDCRRLDCRRLLRVPPI